MEIYKDIIGYEGLYQVSNFGNIKSLSRKISSKNNSFRITREFILSKKETNAGYYIVCLYKNKIKKFKLLHQIVAENFLDHIPNGHNFVINHKDKNKLNNNVNNLEIITTRENTSHNIGKSKYNGVSWSTFHNKWRSQIWINGKRKHLGYFSNDYDAHIKYQNEINKLAPK